MHEFFLGPPTGKGCCWGWLGWLGLDYYFFGKGKANNTKEATFITQLVVGSEREVVLSQADTTSGEKCLALKATWSEACADRTGCMVLGELGLVSESPIMSRTAVFHHWLRETPLASLHDEYMSRSSSRR